jgi:hypothetical protein
LTQLQTIIAGVASVLVMIFIIDLVRRRKLREEYSILWLAAGLVMIIASVSGKFVNWLAYLLNIEHPAYSLFVIALLVGMFLAIHFTVILSKLTGQNWRLTQEIALLRTELDKQRKDEGQA